MVAHDYHIYIPEGVELNTTPVSFTLADMLKYTADISAATARLSEANQQIQKLTDTNRQQSDLLKEAALEIVALKAENTRLMKQLQAANVPIPIPPDVPPVEPPVEPPVVTAPPVVVPAPIVGTLPRFATYLVDEMGDGKQRTGIMRGYIDKLAAAGITEIVMLCNENEIEKGDLPDYMATKKVGWWADTFMAVYKVQMAKVARDIARGVAPHLIPDYFGTTVTDCDKWSAHRGYVLDDVHSITPVEFETVVSAIRKYSQKPIVASFGILSDLSAYLPTINRHHVFVAKQLYRTELADEKTPEKRTDIITRWLEKPGMICHVGNLEYFNAGGVITSGDDLRHMYNRCIRAGLKSFMGYAAVDSNGFKIWEHPDLWQAFKDCAAAYPDEVKIPQTA